MDLYNSDEWVEKVIRRCRVLWELGPETLTDLDILDVLSRWSSAVVGCFGNSVQRH